MSLAPSAERLALCTGEGLAPCADICEYGVFER